MLRRIPGRCYLCGDPALTEWFCAGHLWAAGELISPDRMNELGKLTKEHAYWIERMTPEQIVDLAAYLPKNGVAA